MQNHIFFALTNNVTYHGIGSGAKCPNENAKKAKYISHGIGDGQIGFAMMFNENVKKYPAYNTNGTLKN